MALNFGTAPSDFLPYLKFNAKAGRFYKRENDMDVEVEKPTFVADFANLQTGWFCYAEGQAPSITLDPSLEVIAPKPSDKHKRGFKVEIFAKQVGGLVEFASASMHACKAIGEVYDAYEAGKAANAGKLPVIACTSVQPQKDKLGTNYKPVFEITKWVEKPVEFTKTATATPAVAAIVDEF